MTRKITRTTHSLRVIAQLFVVLTVLSGLVAGGQTEGESQRTRQEHDLFGASTASESSQLPKHSRSQPGNAARVVATANAWERPNPDAMDSNDPLFLPPIAFGSGGFYARVAVGDVNGDGKLDAIAANCAPSGPGPCPGSGVLGVLLGIGDGTFQAAVTYDSGGFGAMAAAVADVNGDGKADVVVANFCAGSNGCPQGPGVVGVLLGNGDGTLKTAVTYASGGYGARSIVVADVNGDGKRDLLVSNECNGICNTNHGGVGVLLGNGDGTFKTPVPYDAGGGVY